MRFPLTVSLLLFILFSSISCYEKIDGIPAPPVINLANCRIVKAMHKTIYTTGPKTGYEQLTVAGLKYDIYDLGEKQYSYDEQGRLVREYQKNYRSSADIHYTYSVNYLFISATVVNDNTITQATRDTITLNAKGYDGHYLYDDQGHQLSSKTSQGNDPDQWKANNKVYYGGYWEGGKLFYVSAFDLTRPALPTIYAYQGVGNQNLITSLTTNALGIPYLKDGPLYRVDYTCEYDVYGRVKRQIEHDTKYPGTGWSFGINTGGISVTDFEYECP